MAACRQRNAKRGKEVKVVSEQAEERDLYDFHETLITNVSNLHSCLVGGGGAGTIVDKVS